MHKKAILKKCIGMLVVIAGILLMGYPFISEWLFEHRNDSIVETYKSDVNNAGNELISEEYEKAQKYNEKLLKEHVKINDPFSGENNTDEEYMSLLNLNGNGCMGYVEIPCISVKLPIYHGTDANVLESGVGHIEGTSLPVGGIGTHTSITGHTGLNKAKLFTDLTQLKTGDIFVLYVLNQNIAYEVDQIKVVTPDQVSDLEIENDKDYCTLITCTPYGINSHRLMVRGHRTDYDPQQVQTAYTEAKSNQSQWKQQYKKALTYGVVLIVVLLGAYEIVSRIRRASHKDKLNKEEQ